MLCVVCPHCHQMMTAPVDAVGESVACPSCKKTLQVPPNAPHLPKHLMPGGGLPAATAQAKAASIGAAGGRVGAAVAAPPVPGAPPNLGAAPPRTRSTLPIGLIAVVAVLVVVGIGAVVIIPKLGGKKTVITKKKDIPNLPSVDPTPPDVIPPSDLTAAKLFKAYYDNALAAEENYKDKTVTLTGKVTAVGGQGEPFVNLYGIDSSRDLTKIVRCYFPDKYRDRLKSVMPGHVIHVKGTCKGLTDGRVVVRECSFVASE